MPCKVSAVDSSCFSKPHIQIRPLRMFINLNSYKTLHFTIFTELGTILPKHNDNAGSKQLHVYAYHD